MVKAENISTFAKLIHIAQYILKQMILKYLYRSVAILLYTLILVSCLGSNDREFDPSKDAQIYAFGLSSVTDTSKVFTDAKFSIDQINGLIFNRDSLPYLFEVDSIFVNIANAAGFTDIAFKLVKNDSTYTWNGKDSVAMHRLSKIETTAGDGKTKKQYDISINIHQQDPYIIKWNEISGDYLNKAIQSPKTISFKQQFITYYKVSNGDVQASVTSSNKGNDWKPITLSGPINNIKISSITSVTKAESSLLYAMGEGDEVYKSEDGATWNEIDTDYNVKSIYGELPLITDKFAILTIVEDNGEYKFATTDDFSTFNIMNDVRSDFPIEDYSAVSINNPAVYTANYIILYGGKDKDGAPNKNIWILQQKDNKIAIISKKLSFDLDDAQVFSYDDRVYMLTSEKDENKLYFSDNYGLDWKWGGENQELDESIAYRTNASVISDSDNYIWIFGGKSKSQTQIIDVWRGRLNKLAK